MAFLKSAHFALTLWMTVIWIVDAAKKNWHVDLVYVIWNHNSSVTTCKDKITWVTDVKITWASRPSCCRSQGCWPSKIVSVSISQLRCHEAFAYSGVVSSGVGAGRVGTFLKRLQQTFAVFTPKRFSIASTENLKTRKWVFKNKYINPSSFYYIAFHLWVMSVFFLIIIVLKGTRYFCCVKPTGLDIRLKCWAISFILVAMSWLLLLFSLHKSLQVLSSVTRVFFIGCFWM